MCKTQNHRKRTVTGMADKVEIYAEQLLLINKYFPLTDLYRVCKDLQDGKAIALIGHEKHPDRTKITITWS